MRSIVGIGFPSGKVVFDLEREYNSHDFLLTSIVGDSWDIHDYVRLMFDEKYLFISPSVQLLVKLGKNRFFELMKTIFKKSEEIIMDNNYPIPLLVQFDLNFIDDAAIYNKYFILDEEPKFINKLRAVINSVTDEDMLQLKVFSEMSIQENAPVKPKLTFYRGLIDKNGNIILPKKLSNGKFETHEEMYLRLGTTYAEGETQGYVRFSHSFFINAYIEREFSNVFYVDFYAPSVNIQLVRAALRNIMSKITDETLSKYFFDGNVQIPLPTLFWGEIVKEKTISTVKERDFDLFLRKIGNRLQEAAPYDYYYYFGWIKPNGKLLLPSGKLNYSHYDLLPTHYGSEQEAMNDGYIRFISQNDGTLAFETSLQFVLTYGPNTLVSILKNGLDEIEKGILTGTIVKTQLDNPPLPVSAYIEFFPPNAMKPIAAPIDIFTQVVKNRLNNILNK